MLPKAFENLLDKNND